MLKKLNRLFTRLSLTKQLVLILCVTAVGVVLFIIPYIEVKMHSIVSDQLFTTITDSQKVMIAFYEGEDKFVHSESKFDFKVSTLLYDIDKNTSEPISNRKDKDNGWELLTHAINPKLTEMIDNQETTGRFSYDLSENREVYFVITHSDVNENKYWISYAFNDISSELLETIRNELVNVLYGVIVLIALIIILWIYTIIKPLRLLTSYIRAIKQGKNFTLEMSRMDEIGEVGDALIEMEAELKRQNKLQSDMIHNISHDLKTPIAIIRSYSECMKDDIYPYGDKNSSLDIVIENADRLENKVKDFLYLNRLDYLEEKEECQSQIDIGAIASHLVSELAPLHEKINFVTNISSAMYIGEYDHWYSALMNILDNAIRYAHSTIMVSVNEQEIRIFNDGSNIDDKLKDEIFEPYTKGPKGNFGLGMSIVYKIVNMYHCEITVDNIDNGVVFIIKKTTL